MLNCDKNKGFIHFDVSKTDIKKLNSIFKSKTKKTKEKRYLSFFKYILNKSPYQLLFNKEKIEWIKNTAAKEFQF